MGRRVYITFFFFFMWVNLVVICVVVFDDDVTGIFFENLDFIMKLYSVEIFFGVGFIFVKLIILIILVNKIDL